MSEFWDLTIVGGGPAGLRAAEVAACAGIRVALFEAMPSVGRKFLIAGRGGLNLTRLDEQFPSRYSAAGMSENLWPGLLSDFGPDETRQWAHDHGIETFIGSGKRVYPVNLKAAPLLRKWVASLKGAGVRFFPRHYWKGVTPAPNGWLMDFKTRDGKSSILTKSVILALGGGSWPATGSDGSWVKVFEKLEISVAPLVPANCGWEVDWPHALLSEIEGQPLKNISVRAGGHFVSGELTITRYGLEGGPIYALTPYLRSMLVPEIFIDLKPALSLDKLISRLSECKNLHLHEACERWRLDATAQAFLRQHPLAAEWDTHHALASAVKECPLRLKGPRILDEAISSAGGVRWTEVDASLMLRGMPGIFLAGEMLDWEAPTGGYLIQGCLATGTRAGREAVRWIRSR